MIIVKHGDFLLVAGAGFEHNTKLSFWLYMALISVQHNCRATFSVLQLHICGCSCIFSTYNSGKVTINHVINPFTLGTVCLLIDRFQDMVGRPSATFTRIFVRNAKKEHHGGVQMSESMKCHIYTIFLHEAFEFAIH